MRLALVVMLSCVVTCFIAAAEDPFAGFQFSDGKARTIADLGGDGVLVVYACGHCPTAGHMLDSVCAPLANEADKKHQPFTLVVVTPDHADEALREWAKSHGLDRCLVATDKTNLLEISTKNIYQVRGYDEKGAPAGRFSTDLKELQAFAAAHGAPRLVVPGLTDPKVTDLWWQVERRRAKAVPNLLAAAKAKSPQKPQLDLVVEALTVTATAQQKALVDGPADLATLEGLEELLGEYDGVDLKPARERLKALLKDKALKPELEARTVWRKCQEMLANPRANVQKEGRANLAELAKRFPDTVYGRKAANAAP